MAQRRLLLIDDEDDVREVAQLSLELVGHWDVIAARTGAEGLARAEAEQPDAILLDVMMPIMDGASTYRGLQANPATQRIPVVLFTSRIFESDTERDGLEGIAVINKPFDPLCLPNQVAHALGWVQ